jgi:hypothetical protein
MNDINIFGELDQPSPYLQEPERKIKRSRKPWVYKEKYDRDIAWAYVLAGVGWAMFVMALIFAVTT